MKKILLTVLIILLCVLIYFTFSNGISIASLQILSVKQIQEENTKLTDEITETTTIQSSQYPQKREELKTATNELLRAKQEYLDKTTSYTDEQILLATQENQYSIEFLLAQVGNHVTAEGVNIKMDVVTGESTGLNNLNFTVNGSYVAITNFIAAIENDTDLNFRIKEFKMVPNSGEILTATFSVKNIRIVGNTSTQTVDTTINESTNENSGTNENTENTSTTSRTASEDSVVSSSSEGNTQTEAQ